MRVAALVPCKQFGRGKRRLRDRYSDAMVDALGRAMLEDVLGALGSAGSIERRIVLTDDEEVARVAEKAGAESRLRVPDPGLNEVIEEATAEAATRGAEAVLVVLGDVALLRAADVEAVVEAAEEHEIVIVAASDGGTSMLLRRPPLRIPARFGAKSAAAHAAAARERGVEPFDPPEVTEAARTDIDTPADAERALALGIPCRTAELLRKLTSGAGLAP